MMREPDWDALDALFASSSRTSPSGPGAERVIYLGEAMPKWLARDLMQERAAIREFCAGMTRAEAEALAKSGVTYPAKGGIIV